MVRFHIFYLFMNKSIISFLIAIKNASLLKKEIVTFFFNKKFILLSKVLYKQGLIQDFWLEKQIYSKIKIIISLKYFFNFSNFLTLKIVSKSCRPLFFSYKDLCKLYEKQVLYIFSTSKGYLTSFECKRLNVGGVLFFYVK